MFVSNTTKVKLIVAVCGAISVGADAGSNSTPFLNSQTCAKGYVPGSPQTGCVREVDLNATRVEVAKRKKSDTGSAKGVPTVSPNAPTGGAYNGTGTKS